MSENEIILVGGSKDGLVTEGASGLQAVHNIVLNDSKDGPKFIDRYVPTGIENKDGQAVYAHVGRFDPEESQTYWERLDQSDIDALVAAAEAEEKAEAEAAAKAEAEKEEPVVEETTEETVETTEEVVEVKPDAEEAAPTEESKDEPATKD